MSRGVIQRFLKSLPSSSCLRVFDVNFRQQFYDFTLIQKSLKFANVLKLSDEELPVLASVFKLSDSNMTICQNIDETIRFTPNCTDSRKARRHLNFKRPRSANAKEFRWRLDTSAQEDAFTAAMTIGLLASHHLEIINYYACRVAAFVCSQTGTVPDIPDELHISNIIKLK